MPANVRGSPFFSFTPNFGRFPGDQTLNPATVSLLPHLLSSPLLPPRGCLVTECGRAGRSSALLGNVERLVVANGLRTGHNGLCAPSSRPLPSSPPHHFSSSSHHHLSLSLSLSPPVPFAAWEPRRTGARSVLLWHIPSSLAPSGQSAVMMVKPLTPPPPVPPPVWAPVPIGYFK